MAVAELGDVTLYYTDEGPREGGGRAGGDRPVLLLVHGWGGHARAWEPVTAALPPRFRVIGVDLRGHGGSSAPPDGYRPADLAGDLVALMERLGVAAAIPVGHSMGAQVVTALAVEHPDRVAALVVVDPAYGADDREELLFSGRRAALRADGPAAAVRQLGTLPGPIRDQLLATPGHVLTQCYEGLYLTPGAFGTRRAAERYLARRSRPVLCLRSRPEPAAWEASVPAPPGSRVVTWPDTGHFLHLERPHAFAELLVSWLEGLDGPDAG
ncbi:pimeloyl-ACP methyl ester carboxylesterase [Streptosporangium becharense]|uniref:Pimeloyl-ACP methyl ester carboxylesterase n=1 Tax=Streptosporangium becharense TaxID=1816182 RepID=A0A7W9IC07_9ACTN|nr:alpha/beta hydrolase [Streptosporangium becharense]MBB2910724.1 pimeloyl-ACP methyl ester carboxylesterase [Streptosporangium becharense]MBB5817419.1 pimeloyl-ACP methyl ester carboxylesterase [Streptosporangium becharense]